MRVGLHAAVCEPWLSVHTEGGAAVSGGSTPALKEQILSVLDDLDVVFGGLNDTDSMVGRTR